MIRGQQLRELNVQRAIVIDRDEQELSKYLSDNMAG
jgi:hypothetical protein